MRVIVKHIPNILSIEGRDQVLIERIGEVRVPVDEILDESGFDWRDQRVIVDSRCVEDFTEAYVYDHSVVIITEYVGDPASAITAVVSAFKALAGTTFIKALGWTAFIASTAYSVYAAINQPKLPNFGDGQGLDENSPTYNWDGIATTQDVGIPVPIVYGTHRLGGNIINQFITTDGDKSYLNVLLALCEGEIESISDIRINDNPIANYDGITQYTRMGTSAQSIIPNFEDLHNVIPVNVTLNKNNPHTYETLDSDVEGFIITLNFPSGISETDENSGAFKAWSVAVKIEYRVVGAGAWTVYGTQTITGRSRTTLRRSIRVDGLSAAKYEVRLTRTSDDPSVDGLKQGLMVWLNTDEIKTDDLIYPNLALLGVKALATDQLSGATPNYTCVVTGRKISTPKIMNGGARVDWDDYYWDNSTSEYKLLSDDTVLTWDGTTYEDQYCANPVWCIKDLLTNDRYGLGDFIDSSHLSDADYLEASRICERRVDDGASGYEKLYRMDVVIDSRTNAVDLLNQLATTFDAFMFYSAGKIHFRIDVNEDPVMYFNMGNIVEGSFSKNWKSKKEIYNRIDVQYADEDEDYVLETLSVIDDEALQNGDALRERQLRLFTTKKSYALRYGRRNLKVSELIRSSYSFKAGIDSIAIAPGDVIGFSHDVPQIGFGGRVMSGSTSSSVILDQEVTIEAAKTYKLLIVFADGSYDERTVSNSPGTTDTITVSSAFSQTPSAYDKYIFGEENIYYAKLRVVDLSLDDQFNVEINAVEMDANVYDYSAVTIPQNNLSALTLAIQDVDDLALTEMVVKGGDGSLKNTIEIWFRRPEDASYYLNQYKKAKVFLSDDAGSTWQDLGEVLGEHYVIDEGIITGQTYYVAVVSVSKNGMQNAIASSPQSSITIQGKSAPPSDVTGFDVSQAGDKLRFSFTAIPDGDLARYIIKKGSEWSTGTLIAERIDATEFEFPVGTIGAQTYMCKAIDTSGNESTNAAVDAITVTPPPEMNFVEDIDPWSLNREYKLTNIDRVPMNLYDRDYARDVFILQTSDTWESLEASGKGWAEAEADGDLVFDKTVAASGSIEQVEPYDLGTIFEFSIISELLYNNVVGGSIKVQISYSEDNSTWTSFADVSASAKYRGRYVKFKYVITTTDTSHQFYFYAATITVDAPLVKIDYGRDVSIDAAGTALTFRDDFSLTPRVTSLVVLNDQIAVPKVVTISATGMTVRLWDPVGAAYVSGEINWEVKGS